MANYIIIILLFIFSVTQKILLLNEESLILLCFITFIVIGMNKLGHSLNHLFHTQSNQIEKNLKFSLNQLLQNFKKFSTSKQKFKDINERFKILRDYYKKLIILLTNSLLNYNKTQLTLSYKTKLTFLNKIENKTTKLLLVIIIKKLDNIIKIKQFYNSSIKVSQFLCLNTILIRECMSLIGTVKNT